MKQTIKHWIVLNENREPVRFEDRSLYLCPTKKSASMDFDPPDHAVRCEITFDDGRPAKRPKGER